VGMTAGSLSTGIVPRRLANPTRESRQREGPCRGMEPLVGNTEDTLGSESVYTKQQRIAQLAKQRPQAVLTTLSYQVDMDWLREAYRRTRKDGAAGVDEVTTCIGFLIEGWRSVNECPNKSCFYGATITSSPSGQTRMKSSTFIVTNFSTLDF
jgi:hypothetical protein